jgi:hypothetical protein
LAASLAPLAFDALGGRRDPGGAGGGQVVVIVIPLSNGNHVVINLISAVARAGQITGHGVTLGIEDSHSPVNRLVRFRADGSGSGILWELWS